MIDPFLFGGDWDSKILKRAAIFCVQKVGRLVAKGLQGGPMHCAAAREAQKNSFFFVFQSSHGGYDMGYPSITSLPCQKLVGETQHPGAPGWSLGIGVTSGITKLHGNLLATTMI